MRRAAASSPILSRGSRIACPSATSRLSKPNDGHSIASDLAVRDFWTERPEARREEIALTWYQMGEPFLVHTQPNAIPGRPYGMFTVLVPALGARLTRNGIEAKGRPWPREREGHPSSTCVLGLCETWTQAR